MYFVIGMTGEGDMLFEQYESAFDILADYTDYDGELVSDPMLQFGGADDIPTCCDGKAWRVIIKGDVVEPTKTEVVIRWELK